MEAWFIVIVTLCIAAIVNSLLKQINRNNKNLLPPGPPTVPIIGNFLWLRKSFSDLEPILRDLKSKHGPIVTLRVGSRPAIFIGSHALAHQALVQSGAVFSDRPEAPLTTKVFSSNQHNINSAPYGPTWRLLRRNLTAEILHPSRIKAFSNARRWVLEILIQRLVSQSQQPVKVVDHFQYAMFCLLVLMCFGDKLEENQIKEIETVQRRLLLRFRRFNKLNFFPKLGKILFRNSWKELLQRRSDQENVLIPLIKARIEAKNQQKEKKKQLGVSDLEEIVAYVDTLVDLELPDAKRKLNYEEMVTLCSEFLNAGTDTTSTSLQWVMANLVKYPEIQEKLYKEIVEVVGLQPPILGTNKLVVEEADLQRMPYLKAVVLEALRRHPPGHFVLPHSVTEDVEFNGYLIPKNASVNFMVAEMNWDPKVWENPMQFNPERFLNSDGDDGFDLTGSREIKMMSFGAGRRICPGLGLALLHLEYFVANLIWKFKWMAVDGDGVDLSEKQEFTVVMKNPLRARIFPRN